MRRVLVLAYVFPPLGGGGVHRTLKHVKYLTHHGYESLVVTARGRWYPPHDESLLREVPAETHVVAAPEVPLARLRAAVLNPMHRLRLSRALAFIGWPDAYAGWIPGAVWTALRTARRHRPEVVYSTSPPVSAHLVALIVSRLLRLPWVADFRDGWTLNPQQEQVPVVLQRANARLEDAVVKRATRLVIADETIELRGTEPDALIQNGVDTDDLPTHGGRNGDTFRLTYAGTLYGARNLEPVFAALKKMIATGRLDADRFELRLVGSDFRGQRAGSDLEALPMQATGYVDHRRALSEMAASDALLLFQPAGWPGASGKLYEYLATGRPILCVAPDDSVPSRLVHELAAGECASPDEPAAIEAAIASLYRRWRDGELGVNDRVRRVAVERFSREALAGRLADVLDAAIEEAGD
jgi:glycosyltransferase involved in cell wall biosynthesis